MRTRASRMLSKQPAPSKSGDIEYDSEPLSPSDQSITVQSDDFSELPHTDINSDLVDGVQSIPSPYPYDPPPSDDFLTTPVLDWKDQDDISLEDGPQSPLFPPSSLLPQYLFPDAPESSPFDEFLTPPMLDDYDLFPPPTEISFDDNHGRLDNQDLSLDFNQPHQDLVYPDDISFEVAPPPFSDPFKVSNDNLTSNALNPPWSISSTSDNKYPYPTPLKDSSQQTQNESPKSQTAFDRVTNMNDVIPTSQLQFVPQFPSREHMERFIYGSTNQDNNANTELSSYRPKITGHRRTHSEGTRSLRPKPFIWHAHSYSQGLPSNPTTLFADPFGWSPDHDANSSHNSDIPSDSNTFRPNLGPSRSDRSISGGARNSSSSKRASPYPSPHSRPHPRHNHVSSLTPVIEETLAPGSEPIIQSKLQIKPTDTSNKILPIAFDLSEVTLLCQRLFDKLSNKSTYKALLNHETADAQKLLDFFQILLDHSQFEVSLKPSLLAALLRLSKKSGLYPQCLTLKDVEREPSPLAAGHFGEIFKGSFLGQAVCLKVIKVYQKSSVEHLLKSYMREAALWSHISHTNLLPFYGIYHLQEPGGRICLVSPWMQNGNINEYLDRHPDASRFLLTSDVAQGLQYLHQNNIVHGDLKGANILVSDTCHACVADFGLSTIIDANILRWTSMESSVHAGGTVRWQAPELIHPSDENLHSSKESDVYAFGCVCYEIFTSKLPFFEVPRDATVMFKVMSGMRPSWPTKESLSWTQWGLTDEICKMMEQCWDPEPGSRPLMEGIVDWAIKQNLVDGRAVNRILVSPSYFRNAMHGAEDSVSQAEINHVMSLLSAL